MNAFKNYPLQQLQRSATEAELLNTSTAIYTTSD